MTQKIKFVKEKDGDTELQSRHILVYINKKEIGIIVFQCHIMKMIRLS